MNNAAKLALFVGGNADGFTQEVTKIEPVLNWYGNSYISRGPLETRTLGTVQLYVLAGMKRDEEILRTEIIKKSI
jgi:hypothetical protein